MAGRRERLVRMARLVRAAAERPVDPDSPDTVDRELLEVCAPWVDAACRAWFRLDVRGLDRIPEGPALLVGNHNSGVMFLEALGVGARWYVERGVSDPWHGLAHDAVVDAPVVGRLLCRTGAVRAGHGPAARAFAAGRKVVVFPGGNREAFRPWSRRHQVEFHGRTGFVKLALEHGVPIFPVAFVGGHDGFLVLREGRRLARWLGADRALRSDTWPLYLGLPWGVALGPLPHLPLPVRCVTEVLEPIPTARDPAPEDRAVRGLYDLVVRRLQEGVDRLAIERSVG